MNDHQVRVAHHQVDAGLLWHGLTSCAHRSAHVLRYYDEVADDAPVPAQAVDACLLGRLVFVDRGLTAIDAAQLLEADIAAVLAPIPPAATLAEADPGVDGGLYDDAERLHRVLIDANIRISATVVSAASALLRPALFPLLTAPTRLLYREVAEQAWHRTDKPRRPFSRRSYWPAIRTDVLAASEHLAEWREKLAASEVEPEQWLGRVSDIRLWVAATSVLAAGTVPGAR